MLAKRSLLQLFLLATTPLLAIDPRTKITNLVHTSWSGGELGFGGPYNLAQTNDGVLWMASQEGLFRFDGVRFSRFEPLSRTRIFNLIAARDGSLWVLLTGGKVGRLFKGNVTSFSPGASAIVEDRDGSILATTSRGLTRFRDGAWVETAKPPQHASLSYRGLWFDKDGTLWLATQDRFLKRAAGESEFSDPGIPVQPRTLRYLVASQQDGTVWFAGPQSVHSWKGNRPQATLKVTSNLVMVDREGSLWIGGEEQGLWRVPFPGAISARTVTPPVPALEQFTAKDGLSGNRVWCALEDREGNIWVGTNGGLDRFRKGTFSRVVIQEPETVQETLGQQDGGLPLRMRNRDYMQRIKPDGSVTLLRFPRTPLTFTEEVRNAICEDTDGSIWLATSTGLGRLSESAVWYPPQPPLRQITQIECSHGEVWADDTGHGVVRFASGKISPIPEIRSRFFRWFAEGPGKIWTAYDDGQVRVYDNGSVRQYGRKDGLPEGQTRRFFRGADGEVWLAGEGGLARFRDGRFAYADVMNGRLDFVTSGDKKSLWLRAGMVLTRLDVAEFDRAVANPQYRPQMERYGAMDGVRGALKILNSAGQRIWVSTTEGAWYRDLGSELGRNPIPPPVQIEGLTADGKPFSPSHGVTLPKLTHDLQIEYTAFSLTMPERVQFRYKLEGVDREWQEVGTRRRAYYTDLAPKAYRFRVMACNNDGVWNEAGASLDFSIAPAFYQTRWFQGVCVAVVLLLCWGLHRYRMYQMARRFKLRFEERVNERSRIARELHDTLLQSFHGLMLRFQVVDHLLPPGSAKEELQQSLERADQAIAEGRRAVFDLRYSAVAGNDLAEALRTAVSDASDGRAALCIDVQGAPRELQPILRDEVYRIGCEALRNALKHAQARKVEAEIAYGEQTFRLQVRDDGRGIPAGILEEGADGHYGLPGMRERALQIGGKLEISTAPVAGTVVQLSIPASIAYRASAKRTRLQLFSTAVDDL